MAHLDKVKNLETQTSSTLYKRLGGTSGIQAIVEALIPRLLDDPVIGRYWATREFDEMLRERELLIDFLSFNAGGPVHYTGRSMADSHRGLGINEEDWKLFIGHINETLNEFQLAPKERNEVITFIDSIKLEIIESKNPTGGKQ